LEVFGPRTLSAGNRTPRYGFSDEIIITVESGEYRRVISGSNVRLCGSIFCVDPVLGDGKLALPLMMRLARSEVIIPTNYSEGQDLDVWSATPEAGAEMITLAKQLRFVPHLGLKDLLRPDSSIEAGRSLYARIMENYYE
jgi:hypothetical protein